MGNSVKSYSSKCNVKNKPSDEEFLLMVKTAWNEMNSSYTGEEKKRRNEVPFAMIGLSIDDQVYFASSVKAGKKQIIYQKAEAKGGQGEFNKLPPRYETVTEALKKCAKHNEGKGAQHGNSAACGEIMSTILWMHDHEPELPKDHQPRVAAWCPNGYLPPCSSDAGSETWGCHQWTAEMGYTVVKNQDLPDDFTKPEKCEAVSLNTCLKVTPSKEDTKSSNKHNGSGNQ
jgi:hypothetical protein